MASVKHRHQRNLRETAAPRLTPPFPMRCHRRSKFLAKETTLRHFGVLCTRLTPGQEWPGHPVISLLLRPVLCDEVLSPCAHWPEFSLFVKRTLSDFTSLALSTDSQQPGGPGEREKQESGEHRVQWPVAVSWPTTRSRTGSLGISRNSSGQGTWGSRDRCGLWG